MAEANGGMGANEPVAELVALARAVRALTEQMLRVARLPDELRAESDALRARIDAFTERLLPHAPDDATPRFGPGPPDTRPYLLRGVMIGEHHPFQPDWTMRHEDGVTRGRVRFGVTFEGPPGCVHGGFVSHFFDQILGQHNLAMQVPAMTGTLTIRFRRGTPILRDLDFEVRHEREGDRKIRTVGTLAADGEVFAEGEGLFVVPRAPDWTG